MNKWDSVRALCITMLIGHGSTSIFKHFNGHQNICKEVSALLLELTIKYNDLKAISIVGDTKVDRLNSILGNNSDTTRCGKYRSVK